MAHATVARRACAALIIVSCGGDTTAPHATAATTTFAGFYRAIQENSAGACIPVPLPAPMLADTIQYVSPQTLAAESIRVGLRVTHLGENLTVVPSDTIGRDPAPPFQGSIRPDGAFTIARTLQLGLEGPREGGRRFHVEQYASVQGRFEHVQGLTRHDATGIFVYRFREGGSSGAVFTTCSRPFRARALRVSV